MKTKTRPYWYIYIYYECPVCGARDVIREKRYCEKPKEKENRHVFGGYLSCQCYY